MFQAGDLVEFHNGTVVCLIRPVGFEHVSWHVIVTVGGDIIRKGTEITMTAPLLRSGSIIHSEVPTTKRVLRAVYNSLPAHCTAELVDYLRSQGDGPALDLFHEANGI